MKQKENQSINQSINQAAMATNPTTLQRDDVGFLAANTEVYLPLTRLGTYMKLNYRIHNNFK